MMRKLNSPYLLLLVLLLTSPTVSAQNVTLSNNLLYDAWLTPNMRLGVRLSPHWSMGITAGYRPWPTDDSKSKKWKHLLISPDLRYWTDSVDVRHFFGVNLIYSHYNVAEVKFPFGLYKSVRNERRQGDLGAVGVYYGYSWPLGRFWNVEALIGVAVGYTKYDRFECGHCGTRLGSESKLFAMPQAGISIVYNIPGRPAKRVVVPEEPVVIVPQPVVKPDSLPARQAVKEPEPPVVNKPSSRVEALLRDNPVLVHISQYKPYNRTRVLRKEKGALYVHFPLGKSEVQEYFRENGPTLERIVDVTRQMIADSTSSVKKIQIVGLASVEGGTAANEQLATSRALALQHYVQERLDVPDSLFDTVGGGEAWAEFRDQLNDVVKAADSDQAQQLQQAIDIIDNEEDPDAREQQLRRLNRGRTWQYIRQHILGEQRNSGYIRIYYDNIYK